MRFFATRFSRIVNGLLTCLAGSGIALYTMSANQLKSNDLKTKESFMPKARNELKNQDKWNVEALYPTPQAWTAEFEVLKGKETAPRWPQLISYKGQLNNPASVASLFEIYFGLDRKLAKLHTYAHLRMDEDLGNDLFKKDYGLISSLYHDYQHECAWIEPELLRMNEADFQRLSAHSELRPFNFFLEKIARMRPHILSSEQEELFALSGKALDAPSRAFSALNNADLTFQPAIDGKGKEHPLTNGSYLSYMRSTDRELRKSAFQNLHRAFEAHVNTIAELLQGQVQAHLYNAKARQYQTCVEAALFPHGIDSSVYENLIAAVRRAHPIMHRYVALRKKLLGLSDLHYYDLMVPIVENVQLSMTYPEAVAAVVESVGAFGQRISARCVRGAHPRPLGRCLRNAAQALWGVFEWVLRQHAVYFAQLPRYNERCFDLGA